MSGQTEVVVGLDAGTTSAKAVAVDSHGRILGSGSSGPIGVDSPSPGASVQAPEEIWQALAAACRGATDPRSCRPVAVSVAAQSGSVVPIDDAEEGHAKEVVTWMDIRSRALVEAWDTTTARSIRARSGWAPAPGLGLATIAWFNSTHPPGEAARWASVDDYIVHRLCGEWITNPSNAAGLQLMDMTTLTWSPELCALAGVDVAEVSTLRPSGTPLGTLTASAAAAMELPDSTRLVVGGHDQACAALALGAVAAGSTVLSVGTAWVLTIITADPDRAAMPASFNLSPHVVPRLWSASRNLGGLGADLAGRLQEVATGDSEEAGVQAAMEASVFEVRRAIDDAAGAGLATSELIVVGGGTRSEPLIQMLADAVPVAVTVRSDASWPALGAARLAASSCGWSIDTADVPSRRVRRRPEVATGLERRYLSYRNLAAGAPK